MAEEKKTTVEVKGGDDYIRITKKMQGLEDSKVLPKVLKHMLTSEQAKLAAEFPGTPEEFATKLGRSMESVKKDLDYMYRIGLGTPSARTGKWNLPRGFGLLVDKVGSHHIKFLPFLGPEYVDLWEELEAEMRILREQKGDLGFGEGRGSRILPAYYAVKDNPNLQPWESVKAIFEMADKIALVNCTCRLRNRKRTCQPHTTELCFLLNRDADYEVDSGAGRYLTVDEAMKVIYHAETMGYIHTVMNTRAIVNLLCNCCWDCCIITRRLLRYGNKNNWLHQSRYQAVINEEKCTGCGKCVTACGFCTISMKRNQHGELKAVVDKEKCFGQGTCKLQCPENAIELECVRPESWIPKGMGTRGVEQRDYPQYADMV